MCVQCAKSFLSARQFGILGGTTLFLGLRFSVFENGLGSTNKTGFMNPIVEKNLKEEAEVRTRESFRYPFHIVCVFENSDNNDFPIIHEVRAYCLENHLTFAARQYDYEKYQEDITVARLPAFHILYKKCVIETHYFNTDPVHKIQIVVWAYQDEMRAKERARLRRQERWNSFVETFRETFSLDRFKKKPALDLDASLSRDRCTPRP